MSGQYFGKETKRKAILLLCSLIDCANENIEKPHKSLKDVYWGEQPYELVVKTLGLHPLELLIERQLNQKQISEVLYRLNDTVNILQFHNRFEREQQGEKWWSFSIYLWSQDKDKNIQKIQKWKKEITSNIESKEKIKQASSSSPFHDDKVSIESKVSDNLLALASPFYIERQPIESNFYQAILKPGSLVRLKGPQQIGKTSLVERLLVRVPKEHRTAVLSFNLAKLTDATGMFKWLCAAVSQELELPNQITTYWDDTFGSNQSATTYFEKYILKAIQQPLILVLDNIDVVFDKPDLQESFCRLLRHWNDITKGINHRAAIWRQLSLVLIHATNNYGSLDINSSPLAGIGSEFSLPEFSEAEIDELAKRYNLTNINIKEVKHYFGGHPYLVRSAFDYLHQQQVSLEYLLKIAPTEKSPFGNHLRGHLETLQRTPELGLGFKEIVTSEEPVRVSSSETFKLQSMGLVKIEGNLCSPLCELYRQYFSLRLQEKRSSFASLFNFLQPKRS